MGVTRREFLGCAAAVSLSRWGIGSRSPAVRTTAGIAILDLGTGCSLRESMAGYERALRAPVVESASLPVTPPGTLIVPAAVAIAPAAVAAIVACLNASGCVILETGAAFTPGAGFESHRTPLAHVFGIRMSAPVTLRSPGGAARIPYVDFTWPHTVKIRDHSRVVPLAARGAHVIASVDGMPVALTRAQGRGTLIVLGSPVGPALWAGDAEAQAWLDVVAWRRWEWRLPGFRE